MESPKISVCIPAFNRANVLTELIDSIVKQDYRSFEIVIAEDFSPDREEISKIVRSYIKRYPSLVNYYENEKNLGYDGNLRHLFELAKGEYVFFMGNDDLMCPGALKKVSEVLNRYSNIGVVLRSYAAFEGTPDNIVQIFRYFDKERFFPAGENTISTIYRRSVVIPGMVVHRESAVKYASDRYDGTLLYQLYLVAQILTEKNAVYVPDITVLYRTGGSPDFGNSSVEMGRYKPREQTPESSLYFIKGMLDIAREVGDARGARIYRPILRDLANYSYPLLSIQAGQPKILFLKYTFNLAKMGLGRYSLFWLYVVSILTFGPKRVEKLIIWAKQKLGYTPSLGKIYKGEG
jgi:glycosyltransferase involved in cell wall biosynthesis